MERKDCEKAGWVEFPWINMLKHRKIEGLIPVKKSEAIPCPGGKMSCSAEQTCCDDGSGGYKCCPLPMVGIQLIVLSYSFRESVFFSSRQY